MAAHDRHSRRWRNQPLVLERDKRYIRVLWLAFLALALAIVPASFYLYQQNECLKLSIRADELRSEQSRLDELDRRLRLEQARLGALPGIEGWALGKRGLVRPASGQMVVVRQVDSADEGPLVTTPVSGTAAAR
jgi:cell division protein FtsL